MAEIPNFPDDLLHLHHAWHNHGAHPELPGRQIPFGQPGGGLEFLTFHRNFMRSFHDWYDTQPFADPAAVAPWSAVPAELKTAALGWTQVTAGQEQRLLTNSPAFTSADELGTFIEGGVHNQFLHTAAADFYHDELVRPPAMSPRSTYFYKIHGLINHWWLLRFPLSFQMKSSLSKDELDTPVKLATHELHTKISISKNELDNPPKLVLWETPTKAGITKTELDTPPPKLTPEKVLSKHEIFEATKTLGSEEIGRLDPGDLGVVIKDLATRLQSLEGEVAKGRAFIRATERPAVGDQPAEPAQG